jgi:hypothetical protein
VDVELDPPQPDAVTHAIADTLTSCEEPDPWWQAGIDAALGND